MNNIPKRAIGSSLADNLLRQSNYDLFVYIEDEKLVAVYKKILHKILGGNFKIGKIYPMKSKKNVLKAFEQWKRTKIEPQKSIFIIDRDFDHLKGITVPDHSNLIELEYYTIENYLVSLEGAVNLIQIKIANYSENEIEEMLQWEIWEEKINEGFKDLFISYAIAYKYDIKQNCSISPYRYLKKNSFEIDEEQINRYIMELKNEFENYSCKDYDLEYKLIEKEFIENGSIQYEKLIKGKYKHSAMFKYINNIFGEKFDEDLSNAILADNINLTELEFMKERIYNI